MAVTGIHRTRADGKKQVVAKTPYKSKQSAVALSTADPKDMTGRISSVKLVEV